MDATIESLDARVAAIRHFNRFFTRKIGVLRDGLLHTPYSLTEARILFELAHAEAITATDLCRELGLDAGYLSRILARFESQGLVARNPSPQDGRRQILSLTSQGREAFAGLDRRSQNEVSELLAGLSAVDQQALLKAMHKIEAVLTRGKGFKYAEPFILRPPKPGDMGWVIHRHGALYAQEYGWDASFEALVAQIVADFMAHFKPERERCWIAEMDGEPVGSGFVVQVSESVARLRLLLVEPRARGLGLGNRLVQECIAFAGQRGYQKLVLWTNSILVEARRLYQKNGFRLVEQQAEPNFGQDLVSETWELAL